MSVPEGVPTWDEGIERLLGKLPALLAEGAITINDARVVQYLAQAARLCGDAREWLCVPCNTIHPPQPGEFLTAPCPVCASPMAPTSPNLREIGRLRGELARRDAGAVTEHALQMAGGSVQVRYDTPEIEKIYPLAEWITHNQRFGGKVWRRRVIVLDDWAEVPAGTERAG